MPTPRILMALSLTALSGATALLHSTTARAERADREKPVRILADFSPVSDKTKTLTLEGHVKITQGTLVIVANKAVVTQDAEGFQTAVATSGEGGLARLQQKSEGKDEMVYAEAERIEYDARTETAVLIKRAWIRKGVNETCADTIEYNGQTEMSKSRSAAKPGDQVSIVLPGKASQSAPVATITCERKK
jgi:lipopolysaccharide export system protein LptA